MASSYDERLYADADMYQTGAGSFVLEQPYFDFSAPPARSSDPATSYAAAESIRASIPALEEAVLSALRTAGPTGLTTEQLADRMRMSLVTVSPRLAPLAVKGLVRQDGRRMNRSGRTAIVWVAEGLK